MAVFLRLLTIVLSYLVASLVAGCVLLSSLIFVVTPIKPSVSMRELNTLLPSILSTSMLVAALAVGPALLAIVFAEKKKIRSFWLHAYGGSLIGVVSFVVYSLALTFPDPMHVFSLLFESFTFPAWGGWLLVMFSGFFGGATYWLIAGRNSGTQRVGPSIRPK